MSIAKHEFEMQPLPCPNCKERSRVTIKDVYVSWWFVTCENCYDLGSRSGQSNVKEAAVTDWNEQVEDVIADREYDEAAAR